MLLLHMCPHAATYAAVSFSLSIYLARARALSLTLPRPDSLTGDGGMYAGIMAGSRVYPGIEHADCCVAPGCLDRLTEP
jgi:hypothetical protein